MVFLDNVFCMVDLRQCFLYGFARRVFRQKLAPKFASRKQCPTLGPCLRRADERHVLAGVAEEHVEPVLLSHVDRIGDHAENRNVGQSRTTCGDVRETFGLQELAGSLPVSSGRLVGRPRCEVALSHESRSNRWACLCTRIQNGLLAAVGRSTVPSGRPARKNSPPCRNLPKTHENTEKHLKRTRN